MDKRVNPLNPLLDKIARFEYSDKGARQWESSRVEWTLRRLALLEQRKEILASSENGLYSFAEFNRVVSFPVILEANPLREGLPLHKNPKAIHPLWFKSFTQLPFMQQYEEHFHKYKDREKPIGMVFPRKGFSQGLVVHNGDWDIFVPPNSSCHMFKGGSKKLSINLVVQSYAEFIDNVKENLM